MPTSLHVPDRLKRDADVLRRTPEIHTVAFSQESYVPELLRSHQHQELFNTIVQYLEGCRLPVQKIPALHVTPLWVL